MPYMSDMTKAKKRMTRKQIAALRRAIWQQAEDMCIPAFMTPLWQAAYAKRRES